MREVQPHQHGTTTGYGYGCRCADCRAAIARYHRERVASDPAKLAAKREAQRRWREANPEAHQRWHRDNPQAAREAEKRWRASNPDKARDCVRTSSSRRRVRKVGATIEKFCDTEVFERDNWTCHICGTPVDQGLAFPHPLSASLDHVVPLSRGGAHSRSNTACAHLGCNQHKHARI